MKKLFLLLALVVQLAGFSQKSINDFQYVIVPTKFEFSKDKNPYRLSTFLKAHLERIGFKAYYDETMPPELINNRCNALYANIDKESAFLATKLVVTLKDCQNNVAFTTKEGKSKEKSFDKAYAEAFENAMVSLSSANYVYNGSVSEPIPTASPKAQEVVSPPAKIETVKTSENIEDYSNYLFAQPIKNGYQLVDSSPKVVLKIYKTSNPDYFTAQSDTKNGALIKKNGEWILEYYKDDQLVSEKLNIKF